MKKILILFLIISLSACSKENLKNEDISKNTENIMLNKDTFIAEIITEEEPTKESEPDNLEPEEIIELPQEKPLNIEIKVDDTSPEYTIHKGRIDCQKIDECLDISTSIQKAFQSIINSINYLPVKANNNSLLGYFIVYHFKNAPITDIEACHEMGTSIMRKLSDRIIKYECSDNNLKITTDYGGHNET